MTTISRDRLRDGLDKLVVVSRDRLWEGFGILEEFDPYGEGHVSYRPPGYTGGPIIDDLEKILDGGMIINDVSGKALIKTNGIHAYVGFSQVTEFGLVKILLKFATKERWLPPPVPCEPWKDREITYYGLPSARGNIASHTASLQSYKLGREWKYVDYETGTVVPVYLPHSITDPG